MAKDVLNYGKIVRYLRAHLPRCNPDQNDSVKCNICGKLLSSRQEISNHRKEIHEIARRIKCKYFPDCIDQEECFFIHEEELESENRAKNKQVFYCPEGENCQNQSCLFGESKHKNRKNIMCRFQERCNRPDCFYKHVAERASFLWNCTKNYKAK